MAGLAASLRLFQSRIGIDAMRDEDRMRTTLANLAAAAEQIEKRGAWPREQPMYRTRFFGHKFELSGLLHAGLLPDGAGLARTA